MLEENNNPPELEMNKGRKYEQKIKRWEVIFGNPRRRGRSCHLRAGERELVGSFPLLPVLGNTNRTLHTRGDTYNSFLHLAHQSLAAGQADSANL